MHLIVELVETVKSTSNAGYDKSDENWCCLLKCMHFRYYQVSKSSKVAFIGKRKLQKVSCRVYSKSSVVGHQ